MHDKEWLYLNELIIRSRTFKAVIANEAYSMASFTFESALEATGLELMLLLKGGGIGEDEG